MKRKVILFVGVSVLVLIFLGYQSYSVRKKGKEDFEVFFSSKLNGEISDITSSVNGVCFKLNSSAIRYVFFPQTSYLNRNQIFEYNAKIGDKVIKSAYSDTLKLMKGGEVYLYTFQKLD